MRVAIVGTGYVGLVSGACLAELGVNVVCIDVNKEKIESLKRGEVPIYEPNLDNIISDNVRQGKLCFSTSLVEHIDDCDAVFIAVGTPSNEDGSANLNYVYDVAREFGRCVNKRTLLVIKSTVPIGTSWKVMDIVKKEIDKRELCVDFDMCSNPEFLREGSAVRDFLSPDRVVIGVDNDYAKQVMTDIYEEFCGKDKVVFMDIPSAEMTKYASNAMLATRISFMNEIALLCEATGANVDMVKQGMSMDSRIGSKFLNAGCGYGGSCFPKDVRALIDTGLKNGVFMSVVNSVENANNNQRKIVVDKVLKAFDGVVFGLRICVLGLAFKPNTDDMREAPSVVAIKELKARGANIVVYDPVAMGEAKKNYLGDSVVYATDMYEAVRMCDAVILVTEWKEFVEMNLEKVKDKMRGRVFVDGRNVFSKDAMESIGFEYYSIGR